MSNKFLAINNLKKVLAILGCLLFLFSFIYPLYLAVGSTLEGPAPFYYWSYKVDYHAPFLGSTWTWNWFSNFWFSSYYGGLLGLTWILISLFIVQVLSVVFGVVSVIFNRRILSFAPVLLSLAVIALMIRIGEVLSGLYGYVEYQLGYYLIYPSVILFVSAFALNELLRKRRTTELAKQNQNNLSS